MSAATSTDHNPLHPADHCVSTATSTDHNPLHPADRCVSTATSTDHKPLHPADRCVGAATSTDRDPLHPADRCTSLQFRLMLTVGTPNKMLLLESIPCCCLPVPVCVGVPPEPRIFFGVNQPFFSVANVRTSLDVCRITVFSSSCNDSLKGGVSQSRSSSLDCRTARKSFCL